MDNNIYLLLACISLQIFFMYLSIKKLIKRKETKMSNTETEIKLKNFIGMVYEMRNFQKEFFKTSSTESFANSINAEKRVDAFIRNEFNNEMINDHRQNYK